MELIVGGLFVAIFVGGLVWWIWDAIESKQAEGQQQPRASHPKYEAPERPASTGGKARAVSYTPSQKATAQRVKATEREIAAQRRAATKAMPRGTVQYERIKPVQYEGVQVDTICLNAKGEVIGYVNLGDVPLDWE